MREPTRIGSVVMATLRDRPQWGRVSWTRIGVAEPDDSTDPDYTPWVLTEHLESGRYFHRNDPGAKGVGHYSWDQFEDDAEPAGPVGDAITAINRAGFLDENSEDTLMRVLNILEGE